MQNTQNISKFLQTCVGCSDINCIIFIMRQTINCGWKIDSI